MATAIKLTKKEKKFLKLVRKVGLVDAGKMMPGAYNERLAKAIL